MRTYPVCATYEPEKSTAAMLVVTREAKMWRLRVSATMRLARLHPGGLSLAAPLAWPNRSDAAPHGEATASVIQRASAVRVEGSVVKQVVLP